MKTQSILIPAILLTASHIVIAKEPVPEVSAPVIEVAQLIENAAPRYPTSAVRDGKEGWVKLSFVIDRDGDVVNPIVVDSSQKIFEKEAKRAVKRWKYEPATEDGEAIVQCDNEVEISFTISNGAPRKGVVDGYFAGMDALAAGDLDLAAEHVRKIEKIKAYTLKDAALRWHLKSEIYAAKDDLYNQLASLEKATVGLSSFFPELHAKMLQQMYSVKISLKHYESALSTYELLAKMEGGEEAAKALSAHVQKVKAFQAGDSLASRDGIIGERERWHHSMFRHSFEFVDVEGDIDSLELRCSRYQSEFDYEAGKSWSVPKSWGDCSLFVYGDEGATFTLVEHPIAKAQEPDTQTSE